MGIGEFPQQAENRFRVTKRFEVVGGDKKRSATKKKSDLGWIDRLEEIDAALDDF